MDKEIVRVSHCGLLSLENFYGFDLVNGRHPTPPTADLERNGSLSGNDNDSDGSVQDENAATIASKLMKNNLFEGCLSVCKTDECNGTVPPLLSNSMKYLLILLVHYFVS
jgi:hypothetical protein